MRVSTSTSYESGIAALNRQQAAQVKTLEQISSGRRMLTPSENPANYVRALDVSQAQSANAQYASNRQQVLSGLGMLEATFGDVTNLLQNTQELTIYAGNGTLTDSGRKAIATELRGNLDELLSLANRMDGNGQYLFSGYQGTTRPFADTGSGIQYSGVEGQRLVQVSSSRQLEANESGREGFERIPAAAGGYQSMFKTLGDLITLLETPVPDAAGRTALAGGLAMAQTDLSSALDNVLRVHASVGTRMKEIGTLDAAGEEQNIQYQQRLSDLRDVDYAKAISELTQQQAYLEATQKAFLKVQGLSLFDYIR